MLALSEPRSWLAWLRMSNTPSTKAYVSVLGAFLLVTAPSHNTLGGVAEPLEHCLLVYLEIAPCSPLKSDRSLIRTMFSAEEQ